MSTAFQVEPPGEVLIEVDAVSKRFCRDLKRSLFYGVKDIAADCLGRNRDGTPLRRDEFWALKDVSFTLRRGECLGLIGANGAGKTTLLRIINGLIKPDHGEVRIRGRVGALIALGAGFNPVLTGRENIFVNAAVLGLTKRETDARLDQIIDFAGIGDAIDAPVQSYSSGMTVRLGFAIAAHLEPDILLIDEVLAVGDAAFRAKCYSKIDELRRVCGIIFVSHILSHVARLSVNVCCLDKGRILAFGEANHVFDAYVAGQSDDRITQQDSDGVTITSRKDSLEINLTVFAPQYRYIVTFIDSQQSPVCSCLNRDLLDGPEAKIEIPLSMLNTGRYSVSLTILSASGEILLWKHSFHHLRIGRGQTVASSPVVIEL